VTAWHQPEPRTIDRPYESPILLTKLAIPATRPVRVLRPRLTARLDQQQTHCLLVVIAPAGSGKSSLLSEWCHDAIRNGAHVAWLSLEAGDNDPARFLLYLIAALKPRAPDLGEAARSLLSSSQRPPLEQALTTLLNELSALERCVTLVLDDYHAIMAEAVHDLVAYLVEHAPPTLRLMIASREEPPLSMSRWRVRGQLIELRAHDLRFTHEEATQFLSEVMGLVLAPEAVARLEARTEGWIAGLQLAALSLQGQADAAGFLDRFTGSNRYVADYLFDEVLARQPEPVQEFLVQTSILDRLCGPLCDAVTGRTGSQALLERLESANLFLIPLDEERRWYRYHHLFLDVLRARLQRERGTAAELHERAGAWFEQQELMEEAVRHALAGSHIEHAAHLIERHGESVWARGERHTLEQWLKALPEEMVRARPVLTIHQAIVYVHQYQIGAVEDLLSGCRIKEPVEGDESRDVKGKLLVLQAHLARLQGEMDRAVALSRAALTHLSPDNVRWRNAAQFNLGLLYYVSGRMREASEAYTEVRAGHQGTENVLIALLAAIGKAQILEAQGALGEAENQYRSILQFAVERNVLQAPETALIYAGLSRLRYQWNELAAAETYLTEGLERKHPVHTAACLLELLCVKKAQGDVEGVTAILAQMEAVAQTSDGLWLLPSVAALRVRMGLSRDEDIRKWMEQYEAQAWEVSALRFPRFDIREFEALTWAQGCLASGRSELVLPRLEGLLETDLQQGRDGAAMAIRAHLAVLYQVKSRNDRAVAVLEPALRLAAREGYLRVFLDAGSRLVPVLRQAAAQGIATEYVGKLLDAFREEGLLAGDPSTKAAPPVAPPLSDRELEVLRLVAAGLSNTEIAGQLFLSVGTVKRHLSNISSKLDATSRSSAVARARGLGLL
jgi:ATP/maltotriose-dependent transcriptional regulator MalT